MSTNEKLIWTTRGSGLVVPEGRELQLREEQKNSFVAIKQMALRVQELYPEHGVSLNPASSLKGLIDEAIHVSDSWLSAKTEPNPFRAILKMCHAYRVCFAINAISDEPGISTHLKKLATGDLDLFNRKRSAAKDFLWEVELFAVLKEKGLSPKFEEPDISIDLGGLRASVACKKIYSEKRLQDSLSTAVSQIEKSKRHGLVAINLDDLYPEQALLRGTSPGELLETLNGFNCEFIRKHERRIREYLESSRIFACLVSSSLIADSILGATKINTLRQDTLWAIPKLGSVRQKYSDALYAKVNASSRA